MSPDASHSRTRRAPSGSEKIVRHSARVAHGALRGLVAAARGRVPGAVRGQLLHGGVAHGERIGERARLGLGAVVRSAHRSSSYSRAMASAPL